jgi:hypothetical protein
MIEVEGKIDNQPITFLIDFKAYRNCALDVMVVIISTHTSYVCVSYTYMPCACTLVLLQCILVNIILLFMEGGCVML